MICENAVRKYCCEDISLIENYQDAINDKEQTWDCHHRLEIELNKSRQELINLNLYNNRPANELIFLTHSEHKALHNTMLHLTGSKNPMYNVHRYGKENPMYGKHHSDEAKQKMKNLINIHLKEKING